jgi:signal transduction histidine kinase
MRDSQPIDLRAALKALGEGIAAPEVHCSVAGDVAAAPPAAEALFRCAQEALTNALRHAEARHVWIELRADDDGILLAVRDDGRGAARIDPGSGLRGMRERFEQLGGNVSFESNPAGGFEVRATIPHANGVGAP